MNKHKHALQTQVYAHAKDYVETTMRNNQPHSPHLTVCDFDGCDKTMQFVVMRLEGINRVNGITLVDDIMKMGIPGVDLDIQQDADGIFQFYLHVPWVEQRSTAAAEPRHAPPTATVVRRPKPSFSAVRLQTWLIGLAVTGMFALAKGPYLGW